LVNFFGLTQTAVGGSLMQHLLAQWANVANKHLLLHPRFSHHPESTLIIKNSWKWLTVPNPEGLLLRRYASWTTI